MRRRFRHFSRKMWRKPQVAQTLNRYDLAMLGGIGEELPPSDESALQQFVAAGEHLGLQVELVTKKDSLCACPNINALFIRETTAMDHHTYLFAKRPKAKTWW